MTLALDPYQVRGVDWLVDPSHYVLADEMGLGKTPQAIRAADALNARRLLVICPATLRRQWRNELHKFQTVERDIAVIETGKQRSRLDADVVVISYDLASSKAMSEALRKSQWDVLICDEAHFLKNRKAKRTKAILGPQTTGTHGIVEAAKRVFFLTGTPAKSSVLDTYPFMKIAGMWEGSYEAFQRRYTRGYYGDYGYVVTQQQNVSDFRRRWNKIALRRTTRQVLNDLPPLRIVDIAVEAQEAPMPDSDLLRRLPQIDQLYKDGLGDCLERGDFGRSEHMSSIRRDVGLMKVLSVCQLIDEQLQTNPHDKVVVFGIHALVLKFIRAYLSKYHAKLIFGGTAPERAQMIVDAFQTDPKVRVMVAQIHKAGVGLNLTAASTVWLVEPSWTPADNAQAIKRAHRRGQGRPVMARFVSLAGTIDEAVNKVLLRKTELVAEAVD